MSLEERALKLLRRIKGEESVELNPFQRKAISMIEEKDDNFLIIGPTGVGKTLIGYATILKYGKGFYLAPLRSLMAEKYVELRKAVPEKKVVITNKDYSVPRKVLKDADIRVLSPYKFLIYLDYLEPDDGVVVVDEIHKINSDPEMEVALTAMKAEGFRIVGLSATIHEDDVAKMSRWLNATVIKSDEGRPVPLKFTEVKLKLGGALRVEKGGGYLNPGEEFSTKERAIAELVCRIRAKDPAGGILVWVPTRKEADALALVIASRMGAVIPSAEKQVTVTTEHDRVLRAVIGRGVLIHHGGLSPRNRELVEELFRKKLANVVVSCFTLSHGVNFPVRYLVMATLFNFDAKPLDPSTFYQIAGRAGRPGLDEFGEVIVVTIGDLESYLLTKIMSEKATKVRSRLYNPWTLTKLIAQRLFFDRSASGIIKFIKETYYAQEHGPKGVEELMKLAENSMAEVIDAYFDVDGDTVLSKGKKEAVAAAMGLHPKEWRVHEPMVQGDYGDTLSLAVDAAMQAVGASDHSIAEPIFDYGFLATYLGSWKVREVVEMSQTILDAVAVYVRRVYGWKSDEFRNAKRIVEMFLWGGNPNAEHLSRVLRHDEMKRIIRNIPKVLFLENPSEDELAYYVREVIRLIFGFKKVIYIEKVKKVVEAVLKVVYGDRVPTSAVELSLAVAREAVQEIVREMKAVTRGSWR